MSDEIGILMGGIHFDGGIKMMCDDVCGTVKVSSNMNLYLFEYWALFILIFVGS